MATIKAYTDISQSMTLSKILPIESADMTLLHKEPYETSDSKFDGLHEVLCIQFIKYDKPTYRKKYRNIPYFPCWSLASLLSVLPNGIVMNKDSQNGMYHFSSKYIGTSVTADNPVDACVDMIIRLNELNLL